MRMGMREQEYDGGGSLTIMNKKLEVVMVIIVAAAVDRPLF